MQHKKYFWIGSFVVFITCVLIVIIFFHTPPTEAKPITIGAILTLTGQNAAYGNNSKNALEMAVNEINKENRLNGRQIVMDYEDDMDNPTSGVNAFMILANKNISAIIGPLTSTIALAIAPEANKHHIILLSPSASSPKITNAGDYIFRVVASDEYETNVMARYAYDSLHVKRVGIIYINNDFGVGFSNYFTSFFTARGGKVLTVQSYEKNAMDYRAQLEKIRIEKIDAIYLIGYEEMGKIIRQAKQLGITTQFLSYSGIEDPNIIDQAKDASNGLMYTRQSFDPDDPDSVVSRFSKNYNLLYHKMPDAYAALSYDAFKVLTQALLMAGEDPDSIKHALYNIKDYPCVTGKTTFDRNGDVTKSISIKKINKGSFQYIIKEYITQ